VKQTTVFLIVNSQTGDCRLRKTPSASPWEYVFQVNLEIPDTPIPTVTITIPVPATPAVVTEVKNIPFGIPWAIAEGIIETKGLDPEEGKVILAYTDEGLKRLYKESGEEQPYEAAYYGKQNWGVPILYIESDRWDKLLGKKDVEGE